MKTPASRLTFSFCLRAFLIAFGCSIATSITYAQHTLEIFPGDTVFLDVDSYRGTLQWQLSTDGTTWSDLSQRTYDTIKYVPAAFPVYLRLQIVDGDCDPHYTETVMVAQAEPTLATVTTLQPVNLGPIAAQSGGKVTHTGGSPIVAQGIVYSPSPGPTLVNASSTSEPTNALDYVSSLVGLAPNTTYYIRAYAINDLGPAYGEELQFTTLEQIAYAIGDTGPAGGIIFYDKGSYTQGWRYLEAAPKGWAGASDPWVDLSWGCETTAVGQTSTDVGAGKHNTEHILSVGCAGNNTAVQLAVNVPIVGYTDWFLPSRDELYHMYHNLFNLGANFHDTFGFMTRTYTSSSELNSTSAWGYDFAGGGNIQHVKTKAAGFSVRPVRRF